MRPIICSTLRFTRCRLASLAATNRKSRANLFSLPIRHTTTRQVAYTLYCSETQTLEFVVLDRSATIRRDLPVLKEAAWKGSVHEQVV